MANSKGLTLNINTKFITFILFIQIPGLLANNLLSLNSKCNKFLCYVFGSTGYFRMLTTSQIATCFYKVSFIFAPFKYINYTFQHPINCQLIISSPLSHFLKICQIMKVNK